jgi:uncharacterized membrane protein (DUF485 family)
MNTTSCQPGFASDQIMKCSITNPPACDANLYVYIGVLCTLTVIRFLVCIQQWILWYAREALRRKQHNEIIARQVRNRGKQLPVGPLLSSFTVIMFIVFTVLTCLDIVGCYGPFNPALCYFLFWFPMNIANTIYFRRIARLNRALSPLMRTQLDNITTPQQEQRLAIQDVIIFILIVISFIGIAGYDLNWLIIAPALGPGKQLPITVGMIFISIFHFTLASTYAWQLQQLINLATSSTHRDERINAAIGKLRNGQRIFLFFGIGAGVCWLLVGIQIIEFSYIVIMIHMATEVLATIGFLLRTKGGENSSSSTKSSNYLQQQQQQQQLADNTNKNNQIGSTYLIVTSGTGNNNNNNGGGSSMMNVIGSGSFSLDQNNDNKQQQEQ